MITKFKLYETNNMSSIIDYTYLSNNATIDQIKKACGDAEEFKVFSIVLKPENVGTAKAFLEGTDVKVVSIIDFPKGDSKSNFKSNLVSEALVDGVDEVDVVFNFKKLKELIILEDEDYDSIYNELSDEVNNIARITHREGSILKMIIEIEELTFEQIKIACDICENSGVDFIQTSTGFSKKNPDWNEKLEKVKYMRKILPNFINIKVAGGIRNQSQIDELKSIGVDRIGTSVLL